MTYLRPLCLHVKIALPTLAGWLTVGSAAFAQAFKQPPKPDATTGTGPYVMAYILLILAIALGLVIVCRSSNRRDRARPEGFVEKSMVEQEGKKPASKGKK
ncbi:MAG: hypothetical protein ABFC63_03450 [Thermoguttaceae bacterium]